MVQWFCLIFWRLFDIETWYLGLMSQYDLMLHLKMKVCVCDLYFMVQWICPYILKAIWRINMITWAYESLWLDAWPQNKNGSLWPIFYGSVILRYIFKTYWCINMIPWNNESVWLDALPQNKTVSLWPVFHGSVIFALYLEGYLMYKHDTLGLWVSKTWCLTSK